MLANMLSVALNIPLSYALIFGRWGLPEMGLRGAAWGTVAASGVACLILLYRYCRRENRQRFALVDSLRLDWSLIRQVFGNGSYTGGQAFLEMVAFSSFIQLLHGYGRDVATAVTINFNWNMLSFLPLMGLKIAVTSLCSQSIGAGKPDQARQRVHLGFALGLAYSLVILVCYLGFTDKLVALFMGPDGSQEAHSLAMTMIRMSCIYLLADTAYIIYGGCLKAAGDNFVPMLYTAGCHWFIAIATLVLTRFYQADVLLVWGVFVAANCLLGALTVGRYRSGKWMKKSLIT